MIETKSRPCKGQGKAISVKGCGTETLWRRYGLCPDCLGEFLFGTDAGKMLMHKSIIPKAKAIVKRNDKAKTKTTREGLETKSQLEAKLQKVINAIAREIDRNCLCISSRKPIPRGQEQGGHFISRGSHPALRFHLDNIFLQSVHDNMYKSGNQIAFLDGLRQEYGFEYSEYVQSLKSVYKSLNLSRDEIKEATVKARFMLNEVKKTGNTSLGRRFCPEYRTSLRRRVNEYIGIYTLPHPVQNTD